MDYKDDCWVLDQTFLFQMNLRHKDCEVHRSTQFTQNKLIFYSETLNNEYNERIHQMSYSSLSDNGMLQIFSFLIKWLYGTL